MKSRESAKRFIAYQILVSVASFRSLVHAYEKALTVKWFCAGGCIVELFIQHPNTVQHYGSETVVFLQFIVIPFIVDMHHV